MADNRLRKRLSQQEAASLVQRENGAPIQPNWSYVFGPDESNVGNREASPLNKWWNVIRARKGLITLVTVVVGVLICLGIYRMQPKYRATTIIEIGKENTTLIQISKDLIIQSDDNLKTKKFILRSTPLLEDAIVALQLDRSPAFLSTERRSLWRPGTESRPNVSGQREQTLSASEHTELVRSPEESERLEPFVREVEENLDVEEVGDTRLLKVSFTHADPELAAAVSNAVVDSLIRRSLDSKAGKVSEVSTWLDRQTLGLKEKVEKAASDLEDFTRGNNIVSTEGPSVASDKVSRLHGEVVRAEADRILKQSLFEEIQRGNLSQIPEAFTNPGTVELKKRLNELNATAAQLAVNYGPENPQTLEVQHQIAVVQKQMDQANKTLEAKLKSDYERSQRDEQSLKGLLERAKVETVTQNQTAIHYSVLKEQFETAKSLYSDFLQKTNQANLQVSQEPRNLRVIQVARVPRETTSPKRWQLMTLGLMFSFGTGLAAAFLSAALDTTIRTPEQVKRYVQLPALGLIPPFDSKRFELFRRFQSSSPTEISIVNEHRNLPASQLALNGRSPADEAYRVLRTSVVQSGVGAGPRTMLVTSSQPGDGKTTTAVNTAISLAQLGASVLIIDCDLRTPKVHTLLGVDHSPGLSECLEGNLGLDDAIQRLQIPNLSLLPSGSIPVNPAELISSNRMKSLLRGLGRRYDYILLDSPPLINLADALILSTCVDGVILVVYGGKTTCEAASRAREELENVGANILGVVVNRFNSRRERYTYY